jgi:hypothetical protein
LNLDEEVYKRHDQEDGEVSQEKKKEDWRQKKGIRNNLIDGSQIFG